MKLLKTIIAHLVALGFYKSHYEFGDFSASAEYHHRKGHVVRLHADLRNNQVQFEFQHSFRVAPVKTGWGLTRLAKTLADIRELKAA